MSSHTYKIHFENVSVADGALKASLLRDDLIRLGEGVSLSVEKKNNTTQDFGSILVLVLGTPAVIAISRGIADYLRRDQGSITIEADGRVIAKGLSGKDAARIAEAFIPKR